ncbi:MAG: ribonuclease P protein subunit RPR2 [Candidatus Nitrosomirales archaeon]
MKKSQKDLAMQRIEILVQNALESVKSDAELAQKQAMLAKKISNKFRVRLPYEIRQLYCKKCKRFIVPSIDARVRIGRSSVKAVRITCLRCGHVYRKIIK